MNARHAYSPSLNTDAPELSRWEQSVEDWIDACPFTLYDCDRKELREMAEENTAPDGDE